MIVVCDCFFRPEISVHFQFYFYLFLFCCFNLSLTFPLLLFLMCFAGLDRGSIDSNAVRHVANCCASSRNCSCGGFCGPGCFSYLGLFGLISWGYLRLVHSSRVLGYQWIWSRVVVFFCFPILINSLQLSLNFLMSVQLPQLCLRDVYIY